LKFGLPVHNSGYQAIELVIYPFWKVVIPSSNLQITGFTHAGHVTIDGFDAGVTDATGSVQVNHVGRQCGGVIPIQSR
jgi:hypothetical protein